MREFSDNAGRVRALTELKSTLLLESSAGTGKTALIAGRVTMLLASGVEPGSIAAITFTELAASELSARTHRFVDELLAGHIPEPLRLVLRDGLDVGKRHRLAAAAGKLDELTTATIHGFCRSIIHSYAVEADIDPGARILAAAQADAAFDAIFEQWLKRRSAGSARPGDPIAALSRDDPRRIVSTLQALARFRRKHRTARPVPADLSGRPDLDLVDAVAEFRRWIGRVAAEAKTAELVGELEILSGFYADSFDPTPDFPGLWKLAHPPKLGCMRPHSFDLLVPRRKTAWEKVAGKEAGARLNEEAERLFARVDETYRSLLGRIAMAMVEILSAELSEVLDDYAGFKRSAAMLDFDDLLEWACALVRNHDAVRQELSARYRHILVDEFQDTDPVQAEILFRIASNHPVVRWQDCELRPGALFMVGDPKQAIYQFRGANVSSYGQARAAVKRRWPENVVQVTANFRSRPPILGHVNRCFERPLSAPGQPGYVALAATLPDADHGLACVARITLDLPADPRPEEIRDAEAAAVAELCARLVGNLKIHQRDGTTVPLAPGGIALLAPTGWELWRYERALEAKGLPIASQAGKGLLRRQELQDMLSLARVLADAGDTLAFGALMRGPFVGLTEEELLDIAAILPAIPDRPDAIPRFSVLTDPAVAPHPVARAILSTLRDLRRRSRATTPMLLLAEAVERLGVRPILAAREGDRGARATANAEAFLERARPYDVKGLKRFVRDLTKEWEAFASAEEGRVDTEGDAIEIVTIHSSKGLEWPVVIPINTATLLHAREQFVHRELDDTLHWTIGDVVPPELQLALDVDDDCLARERERVWYVACTRARELLIVPQQSAAAQNSWARVVDLACAELPTLNLSKLDHVGFLPSMDPPNLQTAEMFATERAAIAAAATPIRWLTPSDRDQDRMPVEQAVAADRAEAPERDVPVGAGRVRGLVLHKLMEEVLTGELAEDLSAFIRRAGELLIELPIDSSDEAAFPAAEEIGSTAWKTLHLAEIAALRPGIIPELPLYAMLDDEVGETALAGRADAIAFNEGEASVVLDWKSDVAPTSQDTRIHASQLRDYMIAIEAPRGAVVYMTSGLVHWITAGGEAT